jgi:hypothetical protein
MSAAILENADVQTVEAWLASPEAETVAEMGLLTEALDVNCLYGGAS